MPFASQRLQPGVTAEQLAQRKLVWLRYMPPEQEMQPVAPRFRPATHEEQLLLDWLHERQVASHFWQAVPATTKSVVLHAVQVDPPMTETAVR